MHRVVVTQLLKRGAAIMSRKERLDVLLGRFWSTPMARPICDVSAGG